MLLHIRIRSPETVCIAWRNAPLPATARMMDGTRLLRDRNALNRHGIALAARGEWPSALICFRQLLAQHPGDAEGLNNLGLTLARLGHHAEALAHYEQAAADPSFPPALPVNRALSLHALHRHAEAIAQFRQALAAQPDAPDILYSLGNLLTAEGRHEEALPVFERLLALSPDYPQALGKFFHARLQVCDWRDYAALRDSVRQQALAGFRVVTPFAFLMAAARADEERRIALTAVQQLPAVQPLPPRTERRPGRIRIAYLSADFHDHATAYLMAELFETHDREQFEVIAVSYGPPSDGPMRRRLRAAFDLFFEAARETDAAIARWLHERDIDIAVDLKGHTTHARPGILAYRPARVQATYLGFPGGTGLPGIDYLLADRELVPPEDFNAYSEHIVWLPDTYAVNDRHRPIAVEIPERAALGLPPDAFVYCCFNTPYKLTPALFAVWMRILNAAPGSVLWLLATSAPAMERLRAEARARDVDPARLIFAPPWPLDRHLARYRLADLFLDTLPVNAHTTASDALWAGLPVLTCRGETFAGRVAASLLRAVGLPELITANTADYENTAVTLARSPERLYALRERLRSARETAPLFDTPRFRRHLEAAYREMLRRHLAGQPPAAFAVEPRDPA